MSRDTTDDVQGMAKSSRCRFCGDFGEKWRPWICPQCWATMIETVEEYRDEVLVLVNGEETTP